MAKRKNMQVRLDELFGRLGVEANDGGVPCLGALPAVSALEAPKPQYGNGRKKNGASNGHGNGKKTEFEAQAPSAAAIPQSQPDTHRQPRPPRAERRGAADTLGWEDYLDAIERRDEIRVIYESGLPPGSDGTGKLLEVPLEIGSDRLGALQLEVGEGQELSAEQAAMMAAVSQQVLQHIENLRLLEQAEKYREEAEQATRRLTHAAWDEFLRSPSAPARAYEYGDHRVSAVEPAAVTLGEGSLVCELKVREEIIGEVAVVQAQDEAEAATALLAEIAGRLSNHIENLRLLEETERGRQQLDKRANELETVAQVSTTAASTLDPNVLLQSVVNLTKHSFHLYHAQVYLFDDGTNLLELKAAAGKIGEAQVQEKQIISLYNQRSPVGRAANTRRGVIVRDAQEEAEYPHNPSLPDVRSEMAIPMLLGERLLGVFNVLSDQPQRFGNDDLLTYSTLAAQVSVALRNAELYAEQLVTVERLRELDHLKSSFLANMSHELRTPLNSILGFTQVIMEELDGPVTEDMSSDLQLIEKNGKHLLSLINDVLDMAKIEAGRVNLSLEPVGLADLLQDVLQTTSPLARDRGLFQRFEQLVDGQVMLDLDHTRMRQVLINLVGNAIKFTESGGITIRLGQDEQCVRIEIRDTGIGVPPDKLETIFEAFSQVDTSTTRKVGGTGLGLPISRRLVELHNGRLWAESTGVYGEGSVFYLEFPRG